MAAVAAAAGSFSGSAGAGAAGGPIALAVVLALVITKEIYKARRTERREMLKKKYPPIQVASAAQRLKNILGENGEALAVVDTLTVEQQMTITPPQYQYSYMDTPITQELPLNRQQRLMDIMGWTEPKQEQRRAKTGPAKSPGIINPRWAEELAEVLLNITGGNLNKLHPYSLPHQEYINLMQKIASGEVDSMYNSQKELDTETEPNYIVVQVVFRQRNYIGKTTELQDKNIEKCDDFTVTNTFDPSYEAKWNFEPITLLDEGGHRPAVVKLSMNSETSNSIALHYCVTDLGKEGGFDFDGSQNNPVQVDADSKPFIIKVYKKKNGKPDWKNWDNHNLQEGEQIEFFQTWDFEKRYKALDKKIYVD